MKSEGSRRRRGIRRCVFGVLDFGCIGLLIYLHTLGVPESLVVLGSILFGTYGGIAYFGGCADLCAPSAAGTAALMALGVIFCALVLPIGLMPVPIGIILISSLLLVALALPLIVGLRPPSGGHRGRH